MQFRELGKYSYLKYLTEDFGQFWMTKSIHLPIEHI